MRFGLIFSGCTVLYLENVCAGLEGERIGVLMACACVWWLGGWVYDIISMSVCLSVCVPIAKISSSRGWINECFASRSSFTLLIPNGEKKEQPTRVSFTHSKSKYVTTCKEDIYAVIIRRSDNTLHED